TDHVSGDLAVRLRNQRSPSLVRIGIEINAEPRQFLGHTRAKVRRVLADARGKYESIEPLERRPQHSVVQRDPIYKIFDRKRRRWRGAGFELAHVVADAG